MKKILALFCFCLINAFYAQIASLEGGLRPGVAMETNNYTGTKEETLSYESIGGNPFLTKDFVAAKATCCNETAPMRYDIYADEIQYKKDNLVYTLLKQEPYSEIIFTNPKTTLVLADVNKDSKPGYFVLVANGKNALLKKMSMAIESYKDPKKTGFGKKDANTSFKESEPVYYLKTEKNNYKLLKSKKDVLDLYPEKANELNKFFDINKIKFTKEESLIKLLSFLNQ